MDLTRQFTPMLCTRRLSSILETLDVHNRQAVDQQSFFVDRAEWPDRFGEPLLASAALNRRPARRRRAGYSHPEHGSRRRGSHRPDSTGTSLIEAAVASRESRSPSAG
jgi:hypothetical protein